MSRIYNDPPIEGLLSRIHPSIEPVIRKSLLSTLVNMVASRRNDLHELDMIEQEFDKSEDFGTW